LSHAEPFAGALDRLAGARMFQAEGKVTRVAGLAVESNGPACAVGEECLLLSANGTILSRAQVIGFANDRVFTMPVDHVQGLSVGSRVVGLAKRPEIAVGPHLLGRIVDADARPLDATSTPPGEAYYPLSAAAPGALGRARIESPFVTGVRSIDALATLGRGQRIGVFSGSGVGKSTLLGMIARHSESDVNVIALVGERGREVRDFVEQELGEEGLSRSVVFVATSDEPPLRRIRAALAATAAAEYFRDQGKNVVLMMDSITRVAMAQREVGLSVGEPPSTKGYPPSVLSLLPQILERAGSVAAGGCITGVYTVYVEGDDLNDPIADAMRSLLDGHVVLSRDLADRGHWPAVDVLKSLSRLMPQVAAEEHLELARVLRSRLAALYDAEDLVLLGAYQAGSQPLIDAALAAREATRTLLSQERDDGAPLESTIELMRAAVRAGGDAG